MDPVEAGEWIAGRPLQLVFLTGLDPSNKPHHKKVVAAFNDRATEKPPLQVKVVSGEFDIPPKLEHKADKGILRRDWPEKYLSRVPALIAIFIDMEWDHSSWDEKKTEAESKINSVRAQMRHGTKLALVLMQKRVSNTSEVQAAEKAHEVSQMCSLSSKQLFVLPIDGEVEMYIPKLENSFHEICQSFYQQRLKHIRSRNIPNNSPALFVRQQFKLAFISELRQDTHTALRNYRLAYDQCRDTLEQWDTVDLYEWRSVVGLLNYKMCELCFLHSTALEAINQMRKHTSTFFSATSGIYPTPQLASIELLLWKAKECYHFAQLFERAVTGGLAAIATLNPGTHLDQAANFYASANTEISALKRTFPASSQYPSPDPLEYAATTVFFGQRPWRIGLEGLASATTEEAAVTAISQRLVVNYEGVISLLTAAMSQYKKYSCLRMQRKVMTEMANTCYSNNEIQKALQIWNLVARDISLPNTIRKEMMHRAAWASFAIASVRDFVSCCLQLMSPRFAEALPNNSAVALRQLLGGNVPCSLFPGDEISQEQLQSYESRWKQLLEDTIDFTVDTSRIECFLDAHVCFLESHVVGKLAKITICINLTSESESSIRINDAVIFFETRGNNPEVASSLDNFDKVHLGSAEISKSQPMRKLVNLDIQNTAENTIVNISKVVLELGCKKVVAKVEFSGTSSNSSKFQDIGINSLNTGALNNIIEQDTTKVVTCLVGEIAFTELQLKNISKMELNEVRLEFKRSEQKFTEAAAVLFVDEKKETELKSQYSTNLCARLSSDNLLMVPLMFSPQLAGDYAVQLELSYDVTLYSQIRRLTSVIEVKVAAKEPFVVESHVLNMNGLPLTKMLNNCDHVLSVSIQSAAPITITSVEFLMADVVTVKDRVSEKTILEDRIEKNEIMCYSTPLYVSVTENESDTPLGRISLVWMRSKPDSYPVRSTFPLCRIPVLDCPITISSLIKNVPSIVRSPIEIEFGLKNHSKSALEVTLYFDLNDVFMFCGERKITIIIQSESTHRLTVAFMALSAGRLNFPKITIKSPGVPEDILNQALRALPAFLFVLPRTKETQHSWNRE